MAEQFHIWKGNVKIEVDSKEKEMDNVDKFNTCVHRSPTAEGITISTCCASVLRNGYRCYARKIDFLSPSVCGPCPVYASKINETQSPQAAEEPAQ